VPHVVVAFPSGFTSPELIPERMETVFDRPRDDADDVVHSSTVSRQRAGVHAHEHHAVTQPLGDAEPRGGRRCRRSRARNAVSTSTARLVPFESVNAVNPRRRRRQSRRWTRTTRCCHAPLPRRPIEQAPSTNQSPCWEPLSGSTMAGCRPSVPGRARPPPPGRMATWLRRVSSPARGARQWGRLDIGRGHGAAARRRGASVVVGDVGRGGAASVAKEVAPREGTPSACAATCAASSVRRLRRARRGRFGGGRRHRPQRGRGAIPASTPTPSAWTSACGTASLRSRPAARCSWRARNPVMAARARVHRHHSRRGEHDRRVDPGGLRRVRRQRSTADPAPGCPLRRDGIPVQRDRPPAFILTPGRRPACRRTCSAMLAEANPTRRLGTPDDIAASWSLPVQRRRGLHQRPGAPRRRRAPDRPGMM